jgi:hypothetical protein
MSNFVDKKINRILILVAMEAEAQPLLDALQLSKVPAKVPFAPFQVFAGSYKGHHVTVVTNGKDARFKVDNVGTTPGMLMWIPHLNCFLFITFLSPLGALTAFYAIHENNPDIVINAGTAGGFKRVGASIGDAFITTSCSHHDRRIPIPGFTEYGKGDHASIPCKNLIEVQPLLRCSHPIFSVETHDAHAISDPWLQVRCVHDRKLSGPLRHGKGLLSMCGSVSLSKVSID